MSARFGDNARRIASLAWPVFVGQAALLAYGTVDTLVAARVAPADLAALAIGSAIYVTCFIGLMGTVMAVGPIAGQLYGAGRHREAGHEAEQALWLAILLAIPGCLLLAWPEPFLALAQTEPAVSERVNGYLRALAFGLPASLMFAAYRAFNIAVSRPKAVMTLQVAGLLAKVPLTLLLVFGVGAADAWWRIPALGVTGCGVATSLVMWLQLAAAVWVVRADAFYRAFGIGRGLSRPSRASLAGLLRLGVPMGLTTLVEVTGFVFMSVFIARFGATAVAGHQIVVNIVTMLFMMPLAIANATSSLVAQRIGARDLPDAGRLGWHGIGLGVGIALVMASLVWLLRAPVVGLYTSLPELMVPALALIPWMAVFHVIDAVQFIAAFALRAWRVTTRPFVIYAISLWGIGLAGGTWVARGAGDATPAWMHGAPGYWAMSTLGLTVAALALVWLLRTTVRRRLTAMPA